MIPRLARQYGAARPIPKEPRRAPGARLRAATASLLLAAAAFTVPGSSAPAAEAASSAAGATEAASAAAGAVILMYHRFAEPRHPSTSVRLEQLKAHIETLETGGFSVLPLAEIVDALEGRGTLPDRTVAITVDDAFRSVYTVAWPRLRKAQLPFTLFIATEAVDRRRPDYMSWDEIRELRDAGVAIGSQTHTHPHLADIPPAEVVREFEISNRRFVAELGQRPDLIAYPFGEAGSLVMAAAKADGFRAGFGQHSGVAHAGENRFYLPRFALNEAYGDAARFRLLANALPLPVTGITPVDPLLARNPPEFGFSVAPQVGGLEKLRCFHSGGGGLDLRRGAGRRIEIRFAGPFPRGRSRVNCTMPGPEGRWYWYGRQFYLR